MLCSNRPIHEMLNPHLSNLQHVLDKHFNGMSDIPFSYEGFESTRMDLIATVNKSLTAEDKIFLLGFKSLNPDWSIYNYEKFPAVQWKLKNLNKLKETNSSKYDELVFALKKALYPKH